MPTFTYERRHERPIGWSHFLHRLGRHSLVALILVLGSIAIGMWGYSYFEGLAWRDAFLDTAMLLGGMGPVHDPVTNGGKLFAGFFALYAGLVFIVTAGLLLAPVVHRVLHIFHSER